MSFTANFRPTRKSFPVLIIAGILLTGCAMQETMWQHDTIAQEGWGVDAAQCKWESQQTAEKEYERDTDRSQQSIYEDPNSLDAMLASTGVTKRAKALFANCLKDLGYYQVE